MKKKNSFKLGWARLSAEFKTAAIDRVLEREQSAEFKSAVAALAWERDSRKRRAARAKAVRVRCIEYILQKRGLLAAA